MAANNRNPGWHHSTAAVEESPRNVTWFNSEMKTCVNRTKTTAHVTSAESCLLRSNCILFQECVETYPETKRGISQTSRLGIPHMQRSWKQCAQAAFTLIRPTCEWRRNRAAPSADTRAEWPRNGSSWNTRVQEQSMLQAPHTSKPPEWEEEEKMKKQGEKSERRDSSSSSCWARASNQSSPVVWFCCGTCCLTGSPSVSTSAVSPLSLLCRTKCWREGGRRRGRRAHRWVMRGCWRMDGDL